VAAVFTAGDVPVNEYGLIMADQPVLIGLNSAKEGSDISRWEGDQLAFVVAESEEIAARAGSLIEAEWEQLPRVTTFEQALTDMTLVHESRATNTLTHYKIRTGDIAAGWQEAQVVVEGEYWLPAQEHAYLQPEAGVAYLDDDGRVMVEAAGQWIHEDRAQIAHALGLPVDQVRVRYPAIGGAFGGREDLSLQVVLALAAMKLWHRGIERPIRTIWSREESILGHHKRHRAFATARLGATREGKIVAVEADLMLDAGAYAYTSTKVLGNAHLMIAGPYEVPNARIDSRAIYTNNPPGGAFRGFGGPQSAFVAENQMNRLAAALEMDPVELRLRNVLRDGSELVTQTVMPKGVSLPQVVQKCADESHWQHGFDGVLADTEAGFSPFRSLPADNSNLRRGRGFACAFKNIGFSFGFPERCEATIELHGQARIERAILRHAGADVGQGAHTVMKQMAAEALGVAIELVELDASDTASSGDSGSSSASRMTWMAGNAIKGAATLALAAWRNEERPANGHLRFEPPATQPYHPETGATFPNFSYGYVAEEVELLIDLASGHIHVEKVVCANDVGKILNRTQVEGQIEGAIAQALGYALTEDLKISDGHIQNPRLSTYLMPGILDVADEVRSVILEIPDPLGPWGARGMAEMPFLPLAPAITGALYDATGIWFNELPLTPERVLRRLRDAGIEA